MDYILFIVRGYLGSIKENFNGNGRSIVLEIFRNSIGVFLWKS